MTRVITQRAVDRRRPHVVDPALTALWPQDRSSGLHGPALPDIDFRNRASSNYSPDIVSESGSTNFVEDLVRLQAEAAGDDLLLDLGGAAETPQNSRWRQVHVVLDEGRTRGGTGNGAGQPRLTLPAHPWRAGNPLEPWTLTDSGFV